MSNVRTLNRSFGGGELTPEMYGRIDDAKFQSGLATCRNFITLPHGVVRNRPGTAYVNTVKTSAKRTRVIPFSYSTTQTMVLEFGEGYIRFHTQGSTLLAGTGAAFKSSATITSTISPTAATVTMTIAAPGVITWTGHTLTAGAPVVFTTTGSLPTGITSGQTYYVVSPATNTFQIAATPGGTAITTTGTQTGTHTANAPANITWTGHGLTAGQQVTFSTTGALPTGITAGTAYYVKNPQTNNFEIAQTAGGTSIITSGSQSGVHTGYLTYQVGDMVNVGGVNYYCKVANYNNSPPNTAYWYPMPSVYYEVPTSYTEADLFDIHFVQSADVLTLVHPNYPPAELRRYGATQWQLINITFIPNLLAPTGVSAAATGGGSTVYNYVVASVGSNGIDMSLPSTAASCTGNILVSGNYNTISWAAAPSAKRYNVYKQFNGLYGYIGQTDGLTFKDDNITADVGQCPSEFYNPFDSTSNYPQAVSYFEQRRCFAGTINKPQNLWMTRSGTESNLSYSLPTQDSDSINFRVAAREANTIRHIVPLTNLVLLTSSAEWRVTSINTDAITPTSVSVRPQSYVGASNVQPVIINNAMIYAAARGGHVRELAYNWQASGYVTGDLSLRAPHLFDGLNIVDMCFSKSPQPVVWMVSSSGQLLGITYVPEQQVGSWHRHDTDGVFESCCVVAEGNEDVLYVVVKRTVNGSSVRYVERMASRLFNDPTDAFFVDAGATLNTFNTTNKTVTISGGTSWASGDNLTITASSSLFAYPATTDINDAIVLYDSTGVAHRITITGVASTTVATGKIDNAFPSELRNTAINNFWFARDSVSGLNWLEGKTVSILADGAVHPQRVVTGGRVTLDQAASKVHVGLPITADIQTLPWFAQIDAGFGQGRTKNVNRVWLRVYRSSGIFVGQDADHLTEAKQRTIEPYGSPPALKSDEIQVVVSPTWNNSGQVFVRQKDPLPLTLVSMTLEVAVGS
jgi:hypothetical protein